MKKLLNDFRKYRLKQSLPRLIIILAIIVIYTVVWFVLPDDVQRNSLWLYVVFWAVGGAGLLFVISTALFINPRQLKGHLENLPTAEREQLLEEYETAEMNENGRFFLSKFMLFFGNGGGILRYSIIDRISIFQKGLWIESVSRSVLLRTGKNEDKAALMNALIERTNAAREQKETENE